MEWLLLDLSESQVKTRHFGWVAPKHTREGAPTMQRFWKVFPVFLLVLAFVPVTRAMPVQDDYADVAPVEEIR